MILLRNVIDRVINNVLTDPLLTTTPQLHNRRQPFKSPRVKTQPLELTPLNPKGQIRNRVKAGHATSLEERGGGSPDPPRCCPPTPHPSPLQRHPKRLQLPIRTPADIP